MLIEDPAGGPNGTPPHAASAEQGATRTHPSSARTHSPLHNTVRRSHDRPRGRGDKEDSAC